MKKKLLILLTAAAVIVIGSAAVLTMKAEKQKQFLSTHVIVEDQVYSADEKALDLRGKDISTGHFEELSGKLPQCRILWDVPFQGQKISSDTENLTVKRLTDEDLRLLGYFPDLKYMDASDCRDYPVLMKMQEKWPRCHLQYTVEIGGRALAADTEEISLSSGESSGEELLQNLRYLKNLKKVRLEEPEIPAKQLRQLMETYPKISFSWNKTVFGKQYESSVEFLDLSGKKFSSLGEVADQAAYLPGLKQVDMLNCGFSNDEMRKFRDQVRSDFKVVWNVKVGTMDLRTDIKDFYPDRDHGKTKNNDTANLRYCEDLICVDVGHLGFSRVDWVEGTPHLKYLIMSDGGASDLTPLGQLQELEFLELFMTGVVDTSPLLNCKGLRDLNLCRTPLDDITPLTKMTWLEKLWVSHCPLDREERELLRRSLPNTYIEMDEYFSASGGWRDMPRYFEMRDILRVPYLR